MNSRIAFDTKNERYYVKSSSGIQNLSGLHRLLSARFYPPGSTYANIKHGKRHVKAKLRDRMGRALPRMTHRKARNLGARVDAQMDRFVRAAMGDKDLLRQWITGKRTVKSSSTTKIKKPKVNLHVYTQAAFQKLWDEGWEPVECQKIVGSVQHGIATAVDVVAKHSTIKGKMAVIEVKTGYDATWKADTRQSLKAPLQGLPDSAQNKAHLQAACTGLLYRATTGIQPHMYVLHLCKEGAKLESLHPTMKKQINAIAKTLVTRPSVA